MIEYYGYHDEAERDIPYLVIKDMSTFLNRFCRMPEIVRKLIQDGPWNQDLQTEEQGAALADYRNRLGRKYRIA